MEVLCVVDLQPEFVDFSTEDKLVDEVANLVTEFKNNNKNIVILEYSNAGDTSEKVLGKVENYPNKIKVSKYMDDGSQEFFESVREKGWSPSNITVCGVNLSYCVKYTILGLRALYPDVPISLKMSATRDSKNFPNIYGTTQELIKNGVNIV